MGARLQRQLDLALLAVHALHFSFRYQGKVWGRAFSDSWIWPFSRSTRFTLQRTALPGCTTASGVSTMLQLSSEMWIRPCDARHRSNCQVLKSTSFAT